MGSTPCVNTKGPFERYTHSRTPLREPAGGERHAATDVCSSHIFYFQRRAPVSCAATTPGFPFMMNPRFSRRRSASAGRVQTYVEGVIPRARRSTEPLTPRRPHRLPFYGLPARTKPAPNRQPRDQLTTFLRQGRLSPVSGPQGGQGLLDSFATVSLPTRSVPPTFCRC